MDPKQILDDLGLFQPTASVVNHGPQRHVERLG